MPCLLVVNSVPLSPFVQNQPVTLMGIDELHTSWLTGAEWRMGTLGSPETDGRTVADSSLRGSLPAPLRRRTEREERKELLPWLLAAVPQEIQASDEFQEFILKFDQNEAGKVGVGAAPSGGLCDGGRDRGPPQALPSRSALGVGLGAASANAELSHLCFGHNRCYKPSLTVEEVRCRPRASPRHRVFAAETVQWPTGASCAIKQNDEEHYRRLLEMVVTEKYCRSRPLPFNRTKPQDMSPLQGDHRPGGFARAFDSVPRKTGSISAPPSAYTWRNGSATKDVKDRFVFLQRRSPLSRPSDVDLSTEVATRLHLVARESPALSQHGDQPPTHAGLTRHSDEDLPRLTKDMAAEVSAALTQGDPNLVLSAAFKLRITQRDLATLREGSWLNDEVINFYLSLVMERSSGPAAPGPRVYCFSTFFLPKLRGGGGGGQAGGHWAVKRWTKAVDLFLHDLILVPLHLDIHWAMAVIDLRSQTVKAYDSMGQRHDDICSLLLLFLREEHKVKKGKDLDTSRWTVGSLRASVSSHEPQVDLHTVRIKGPEIPQQKNGSDCGVFACKYADYISKERPLTFKQCHMPLFRKVMVWEILNQKLL
ncbi:Sentrin-specific protease 2 [Merluccius polli]|uniref:Sentrin-specific protease 2 n=1 Tax=Merluccius polli TaxID=89951 RepID=A0AA47MBK2_MERPO|nr:Sentrin-specific protease 2 [Merluccius polli]